MYEQTQVQSPVVQWDGDPPWSTRPGGEQAQDQQLHVLSEEGGHHEPPYSGLLLRYSEWKYPKTLCARPENQTQDKHACYYQRASQFTYFYTVVVRVQTSFL